MAAEKAALRSRSLIIRTAATKTNILNPRLAEAAHAPKMWMGQKSLGIESFSAVTDPIAMDAKVIFMAKKVPGRSLGAALHDSRAAWPPARPRGR